MIESGDAKLWLGPGGRPNRLNLAGVRGLQPLPRHPASCVKRAWWLLLNRYLGPRGAWRG